MSQVKSLAVGLRNGKQERSANKPGPEVPHSKSIKITSSVSNKN